MQFQVTPPVRRSLFDFGFGIHGLRLMHYLSVDFWDRVNGRDATNSFTDVSERNTLRAAATAMSRSDVIGALHVLRVFGRYFHNHVALDWSDVTSAFIASYKGAPDTDPRCPKLLSYWVTNKFSNFRSVREFDAAQDVRLDFHEQRKRYWSCSTFIALIIVRTVHTNAIDRVMRTPAIRPDNLDSRLDS
ncbi:LOW QUALITY PROTEIN: hypothetical protein PHMEG_0003654 [Phytophthora megakarya]|uniref:Uncharacterized protein n=1 Tax=Phytophthora megakarya TaxID=4795 RepID=A0A225WXC2_9STRA|nr:LOW QUALITY PROTEIN: hypothetical protein PHMEG_0003654 [Phytophthora megakarya]